MNIKRKCFNKLSLFSNIVLCGLVVTVLTAAPARAADKQAETPWYEVEVIIFANKQKLDHDTEKWPEDITASKATRVLDLALPGNSGESAYGKGAYVLLDKQSYQLAAIANKINSSSQYEVVLHLAWRQPTLDDAKSVPVFVFNDMLQRDSAPPAANIGPGQGYDFYVNALETGPKYHWLSGTLRLSVSRYLHLESDLHVKLRATRQEVIEESPPPESGFGAFFGMSRDPTPIMIERPVLQDYRLFETRRMRSKEIHYFDHPLMGMVVKVTPYEPETPGPAPQAMTSKPN